MIFGVNIDEVCLNCGTNSNQGLIEINDGWYCLDCYMNHIDAFRCINKTKTKENSNILSAVDIKNALDQYVVAQDSAKKELAIIAHRILVKQNQKLDIPISNILISGPSGSGKTELARSIARILELPILVVDATTYTKNGWRGNDFLRLFDDNIDFAYSVLDNNGSGIIIIDEIDKLRMGNNENMKDSQFGVQTDLLKLVEGKVVQFNENEIDTSNILFIGLGAFTGIDDDVSVSKKHIGFEKDITECSLNYNHYLPKKADFEKYGLISELVGRFPIRVQVDSLNRDDLFNIMTGVKDNVIERYKRLLKIDNISLSFDKKALYAIADAAIAEGTGARGLNSILEFVLRDIMFESKPNERIRITSDYVNKKLNPMVMSIS